MSVSRCLWPAVRAVARASRSQRNKYIDRLPQSCADPACTTRDCRALVSDYFRIQDLARANRARLDAVEAAEAKRNGR